jgi:hypothetical protein
LRRLRRLWWFKPVLKRAHHPSVCTEISFVIAEIGFVGATDLLARSGVGFSRANRRFPHTSRAFVRTNQLGIERRARGWRLR